MPKSVSNTNPHPHSPMAQVSQSLEQWRKVPEQPSTYTPLEMRSISTHSQSPSPTLAHLTFRRVPFLYKAHFGPPSYWFIFVFFFGSREQHANCHMYLNETNRGVSEISSCPPGTVKQSRQVCHSLLFPGHLIWQPHSLVLVNNPRITSAQYNFFNEPFFGHCFPGTYGSIIKRDKHKT